jgi:hypothetical protein
MRTFAEYVEKRDEENALNEIAPLIPLAMAAAPYVAPALGAAAGYLGKEVIGSALDASGATDAAKYVGNKVGQGVNYLGKGAYNAASGLYNSVFGSSKPAAQQGQPQQGQPQQGQPQQGQPQQGQPQQGQQSYGGEQAQQRYAGAQGFTRRGGGGGQADFATNHAQLTKSLQGYANIVKSNPALADDPDVQNALQGIAQDLNAIAQKANQQQQQSRQAAPADYRQLRQYGDQRQQPQGNPYAGRGVSPLPAGAPSYA